MAIPLNDNIHISAGKPSESKYLNISTPYTSIEEVISLIPISERHIGLVVNIDKVDYSFQDGINDEDLVIKSGGGVSQEYVDQNIGGHPSNIYTSYPSDADFIQWDQNSNAWVNRQLVGGNGLVFDSFENSIRLGQNQRMQGTQLYGTPGATIALGYSFGTFGFANTALLEITGSDSGGNGAKMDIGVPAGGDYIHFENLGYSTAQMKVHSATGKGLEYATNYSSTFGKYSLVDKNFVTGFTSGGGSVTIPMNQIPYGTDTSFTSNANFVFDGSNLGIGTTTPGRHIDVVFDENTDNGFRITNNNGGSSSTIQNQLKNDVGAIAYYGLASSGYDGFVPTNAGKAYFGSYQTETSIFTQTENDIVFYPNAKESMRLLADGSIKFTKGDIGVTDYSEILFDNGRIYSQFYNSDFSVQRTFSLGSSMLFDSMERVQLFTTDNGSIVLNDTYWEIGTTSLRIFGDRTNNSINVTGILNYQGNYITGLTNSSLVPKQYVDSVANTTANNGITKKGTRLVLGGALTGTTTIQSSSGSRLQFSSYPVEYLTDVSGFYNNRSIPDKEYVDKKIQSGTPASASDTGAAGQIKYDANYLYVCTATNTWKRTAIASW